jgi:hypothetical protein
VWVCPKPNVILPLRVLISKISIPNWFYAKFCGFNDPYLSGDNFYENKLA